MMKRIGIGVKTNPTFFGDPVPDEVRQIVPEQRAKSIRRRAAARFVVEGLVSSRFEPTLCQFPNQFALLLPQAFQRLDVFLSR